MKKKRGPVAVIREGNVAIPIYRRRDDGRFLLIYRELGETEPTQRPYKDLPKAKRIAKTTAIRLANGDVPVTPAKREQIGHIEKTVERFGVSAIAAIEEWARWKSQQGTSKRALPEIHEQLLRSKAAHKLSPRYMRALRTDGGAFARAFPIPIGDVRALQIGDYLEALKVSDRRRNNIRDVIVTVFLFAKTHEFLPADKITEAEKVKRIELEDRDPRIYTPGQLKVILEHISPEWLDWVCCQAFLGIRPEEAGVPHVSKKDGSIRKLMWTDFLWDEKQVRICAAIAKRTGKIARDRFVTLNETFLAWCGHHRNDAGPVAIKDRPDRETERLGAIIGQERVWDGHKFVPGFDWIPDGLRHSYASYWNSIHKDMARLKEEMGNSERVNRKFYYNPQSVAVAKKWWATLPDPAGSSKMIPLGLQFGGIESQQ
jgi:hypothetical protein